jgi:hypothetical protein
MKIDTYSKVILTGIAIFLGFIAFDYKPSINAQAGLMGGNEMVLRGMGDTTHFKDGRIRFCTLPEDKSRRVKGFRWTDDKPICGPWSD